MSEPTQTEPKPESQSPAQAVLAGLGETRRWQEDLYRQLHAHPELSHEEHETAAEVARRLGEFGFEVHSGIGGTGVVGILANGDGPRVLLRADMDALPIKEQTGVDYASEVVSGDGASEVPVSHACGHDVHVTALLGAASLLAEGRAQWSGTVVTLFQPAEEVGDGARGMVDDGVVEIVGAVDVALAQHVLRMPSGTVGTRSGPVLSGADSMRITLHGRGAHGSMPQSSVDPVVLASMVVVQLQTVVSRSVAPTSPAVLTVGSLHAGSKSNVISDRAVLELNFRYYDEPTREAMMAAVKRIVTAACQGAGSPKEPEFELFDHFPLTINDDAATVRVSEAFADFFGDRAGELALQSASEDFSDIPSALGVPYTYWGIGGTDPEAFAQAQRDGTLEELPANHSPFFAPVVQPTLDTGTQAAVVAALAWLGESRG